MSKKSKWSKVCGHNKGESCHNCIFKQSITEDDGTFSVTCLPQNKQRVIVFDRHTHPEPFCGLYQSCFEN